MQWLGRSSPGGADRSPLIASFLSDWPNKWQPASPYKLLFLRNVWKGQHCNAKSVSSSYSSGGKTEIFSENRPQNEMPLVSPTGKDSPTRGPRHRSDEHERQLYHCPGHSVLNSTIAPLTAFSTSALRNSWTYQQSVSPGLTPTVTRKWSPLVCNELMKHPWKCTVCTVHCTRHTIACD